MSGEAEMTRQLSIVTGCSAGVTESFVVVPPELVKIKYIHSFLFAPPCSQIWQRWAMIGYKIRPWPAPTTTLDIVRQVVRKEGIFGLYAGMEATFWRYVDLS
jgi:solute carrier family 25 2-oxodicarboxylate transporter 21